MAERSPSEGRNSNPAGPMLLWHRLFYLGLVLGVLGLALFMAQGPLLRWFTASSGENLTVEAARQRGVRLDLPDEATDIRFYQHLKPDQVVIVDFAISEDAFLKWAEQQGWTPQKIEGSFTIRPRALLGDWNTTVRAEDGYSCSNRRERGQPNTFSVVFDRKSGRVFYEFSSEPLQE